MDLKEITIACNRLLELEIAISGLEEDARDLKEKARIIREETIPNALNEIGVSSITLDSGQKVTVTNEIYASIPVKNRDKAFKWLVENGFSGLIKTEVKVPFPREALDQATSFAEDLMNDGYDVTLLENVHPQTLKAFIKEQIADGNNIPLDLFGARSINIARIK